jgi:adenosylcobyric acid synthase
LVFIEAPSIETALPQIIAQLGAWETAVAVADFDASHAGSHVMAQLHVQELINRCNSDLCLIRMSWNDFRALSPHCNSECSLSHLLNAGIILFESSMSALLALGQRPADVASGIMLDEGHPHAGCWKDIVVVGSIIQGAGEAARPPERWSLDLKSLLRLAAAPPRSTSSVHQSTRRGSVFLSRQTAELRLQSPVLLIAGTQSSAGKSLLTTALLRYFRQRGQHVAPFKAQNLSNNSRVGLGGEMASAQYFQALAAQVEPQARMNPVLIKPESGGSQVICNGRFEPGLSRLPWRLRRPALWPFVTEALDSLRSEFGGIVVEGMANAAEPHLVRDIANMRLAVQAKADVLLVGNDVHGGGLAQLLGTWTFMNSEERSRIKGFVLNRVHAPEQDWHRANHMLESRTGVPVVGVLPELDLSIPGEDYLNRRHSHRHGGSLVAIIAYPHMSNFDEFYELESCHGADIEWAHAPRQLRDADIVVLPGSKHVAADLRWLRRHKLDTELMQLAHGGRPILGICGGLQMLGERLIDDFGIEEGDATGLGVLPLTTRFRSEKTQLSSMFTLPALSGFWSKLSGMTVSGYQIRNGHSAPSASHDRGLLGFEGHRGFLKGNVLGLYDHGLFENEIVTSALFGAREKSQSRWERSVDELAATMDRFMHLSWDPSSR